MILIKDGEVVFIWTWIQGCKILDILTQKSEKRFLYRPDWPWLKADIIHRRSVDVLHCSSRIMVWFITKVGGQLRKLATYGKGNMVLQKFIKVKIIVMSIDWNWWSFDIRCDMSNNISKMFLRKCFLTGIYASQKTVRTLFLKKIIKVQSSG